MSRAKTKKTEQPRDVTPFWEDRGFRREIALSSPKPNEDPKGEAAYQRAFIEAAKSNPPRLPNPSHYPNSQSAKAYLQKREMAFTGQRSEKRQGSESLDYQQIPRRQRDPDQSPMFPDRKSTSTSPASNYSQTSLMGPPSQFSSRYPGDTADTSPRLASGPRLSAMEPSGAPMGPTNRLR